MMEGEETGHTLCLSQEPECPWGCGSRKSGWTVDAQTLGGWTGMGPGLLLLQGKTLISIFLILLRSCHIVLQK